jgi:hypothetical protein
MPIFASKKSRGGLLSWRVIRNRKPSGIFPLGSSIIGGMP